ncbi:MAG: hypothetical protein R2764_18570 [Bacteroidales bacterium]
MKNITTTLLFLLCTTLIIAQSIDRDVLSSAGDYFEGPNSSISWTLGEIATETLTDGNFILTQGFQQPYGIVIHGIDLDVLVYLEGPYNGGTMNTILKDEGEIPLEQPYNISPWFYTGTENVVSIPDNVVDWVLVDLRDATSAAAANPSTSIERQAAFLLEDGSVVGLDGASLLQFSATLSIEPYVVIWHRNHLGVLSANSPTETGGIYNYDFSTDITQAFGEGLGYKLIDTGIFGMAAGDANTDGSINFDDKALWVGQAGTKGYLSSDFNLDTHVNNPDKNELMIQNQDLSSQVPE